MISGDFSYRLFFKLPKVRLKKGGVSVNELATIVDKFKLR